MKKGIYILSIAFLSLLTSCSDFFDVKDPSVINPGIWDNYEASLLFTNSLYGKALFSPTITGGNPFGDQASRCDETVGSNTYINGEITATTPPGTLNDTYYSKQRTANMIIEKMQSSSLGEEQKNKIEGQAYFFRAWNYWLLVQIYGGVPYVKDSFNPYVDDEGRIDQPRDKTSDCIKWICDDLDEAIKKLPTSWAVGDQANEYGRVTRAAAAAVKGRVLLTYASPMFNPDNDQSRWQDAYDACLEAKRICDEDGHALYQKAVGDADPIKFMETMFVTKKKDGNKEAIFIKTYNSTLTSARHGWDNSVRPYVFGVGGTDGGGQTCNPTWKLVKAFPMKNGKSITESGSGYKEGRYWVDRDPRFYATIAYNGSQWPITGTSGRVWSYLESDTELMKSTTTGFYCRKMTNSAVGRDDSNKMGTDWIEIRYTEVIMNLAECANEVGKQSDALSILAQIRERAGIEKGSGTYGYGIKDSYTKEALTEFIMNERYIEFAFENKRFWDMRRRLMYREDLGANTPKLNGNDRWIIENFLIFPPDVPENPNPSKPGEQEKYDKFLQSIVDIRDDLDLDKVYDDYFEFDIIRNDRLRAINVPENYDFFALPKNIIDRSKTLKQTKGWTESADAFDPYL